MMMENEADLLSPVSAASRNDSTHSSLSFGGGGVGSGAGSGAGSGVGSGAGSGVGNGDFDSKTP